MKEVTIEAVSPFGLMIEKKWVNGDKNSGIAFKDKFHNGDVVTIETNAKGFITSAELVTAAPPKKEWKGGGSFGGKSEFRTTEQIIRSVAVEAAFGPLMSEATKDMVLEEAVAKAFEVADSISTYIEKGV